jgi:hypothetical protein
MEEGVTLRADHISYSDLNEMNVDSMFQKSIQKELMNNQLRLLVGPRGTGKTHQMRLVCDFCFRDNLKPLPLFVSFNKYYRIDKFAINSDKIAIFHHWILFKVILACYDTCTLLNKEILLYQNFSKEQIKNIINNIESIKIDSYVIPVELNLGSIIDFIYSVLSHCNRKRCILLFDDAALVLSPQFLYEFLEIFKNFKTEKIAPKASVYQGTEYKNPRVHIHQEGNLINSWIKVDDEEYLSYLMDIYNKRFSDKNIEKDVIEYFAFASFGITRAFISYIEQYTSSYKNSNQSSINSILTQSSKLIESEHLSMKIKKPQFEIVIQKSWEFFIKITEIVKNENKKSEFKKVKISFEEDISRNLLIDRMLDLLIESGLLFKDKNVSHGSDRKYDVYIPNYLFLINNKTFSTGRGTRSEILTKIKIKHEKHAIRRKFESIIPSIETDLKLNLEPCQNCHTPRLNENSQFCHNCGKKLIAKNVLEELGKIPISDLPLTEWRRTVIKEQGKFINIDDYLADKSPLETLKKIRGISNIKSEKIVNTIESFIEEFLN